jgi:hypothetical protein
MHIVYTSHAAVIVVLYIKNVHVRCRGAAMRSCYSLVQTIGAMFDIDNLPKVLGAQLLFLVAFTRPEHCSATISQHQHLYNHPDYNAQHQRLYIARNGCRHAVHRPSTCV